MARKMIVQREDGAWPVLTETPADSEAQLQEIMKNNPDLLPIDDFGITGPLLVIGRETALPSGSADLICLARSGELLIIEFKKGPQNSDFRAVLAQLLDYGSDLWRLTYAEFEHLVPLPFFVGEHCADLRLKGQRSLVAAAQAVWPDLTDEAAASLVETVTQQLASGAFHYVVVAQRFTPTMEQTVEYLNVQFAAVRFYAVELVRFAAGDLAAFESRIVLKPAPANGGAKGGQTTTSSVFLDGITDVAYREAIGELLDICHALKLRVEWGSKGGSLRVRTPDRSEPLTIGWIFPPGVSGWQGLTDLTLGYDPASAVQTPSVTPMLGEYLTAVMTLPGVDPAKPKGLLAQHLGPAALLANREQVREILTQLVQRIAVTG